MSTPTPTRSELKVLLWKAMNLRQTCAQSAMTEVRRALAAGANPNDGYGTWIPLGWAIRNKAPEIAVVLIEAGAHVNALENSKSLVSMCLLTPGMDDTADLLIAKGAKANGAILRTGAKRGREGSVQWALDAGVDPNDLSKYREPAIQRWPAHTPLPECLIDATFCKDIPDNAAAKLVGMIARRKNLVLLAHFIRRANVSDSIKPLLLNGIIAAKWRKGLDLVLSTRYCDNSLRADNHASPIASCAAWVSHGKHPKNGLEVLNTLLKMGCSVNDTHATSGSTLTVDAFTLLNNTRSGARAALLDFLIERGLQPVFVGERNTDTLAHALIRCNEWALLGELTARYPNVFWEQPNAPGLLATWARHHTDERTKKDDLVNMPSEESLAIVQSLPGFDLQRRNEAGETGLRIFMQRPGGSNFSKITTLLIQAGLNPMLTDLNGVSDIDYTSKLKLSPGLAEGFAAAALAHHTPEIAGGETSGRRRL